MGAGRGRRTGTVLIILIIFVLLIGIGVLFLMRSFMGAAASAQPIATFTPIPTQPPTVNIIVAKRDIPRATRLSVEDVTVMAWPIIAPETQPPPGALIVSDDAGTGLEQVQGRIARVDILANQPIFDFMLTPTEDPVDLAKVGSDAALLVPSGSVAMAVPITRLSAVGFALREGDHVDVLISFNFVDVDQEFQTLLPNTGILITNNAETASVGLQNFTYTLGRQEQGPFGTILLIVPNQAASAPFARKATQLLIDNAIVVGIGTWPLEDLVEPIVITLPPPTPEGLPTEVPPEEGGFEPTPTPLPIIPIPDIITLAMSRQDALVLKYALEVGADVTLVLRSALDDQVTDIVTDTVTLQYILDFYNVQVPPRLGQVHLSTGQILDLLGTAPEPVTVQEQTQQQAPPPTGEQP